MLGRAAKLERLGLAEQVGPAQWTLKPGIEPALARSRHPRRHHQDHAPRDDRGGPRAGRRRLRPAWRRRPAEPVLGRLVERGLHDELKGIGLRDRRGRRWTHPPSPLLRPGNDRRRQPGAIVEARAYDDADGRKRLSLATRSDLTIEAQISAPGATWIDRQLLAKEPALSGGGFGAEVREAMDRRSITSSSEGLARRQGQRVVFARDLLNTLRRRELDEAASKLSAETGLAHRPSAEGEHVAGIYRQRVTLASGRFAMIDDGLGFQLVPWRPALEQQLG